jgi:hypothetical protein
MLGSYSSEALIVSAIALVSCGGGEISKSSPLDGSVPTDASAGPDVLGDADVTPDGRTADVDDADDGYGPCAEMDCSLPGVPCQLGCYVMLAGCWRATACLDAAWIEENLPHP